MTPGAQPAEGAPASEGALSSHVVMGAWGSGEVLDQGALVLRWTPAGTAPVLFAADGLRVVPGAAPHAGVPVCWPWFGAGRQPGTTPAHGFVRGHPWRLVSRDDGPDAAALVHEISSDEATSPHWPHGYRLSLRTTLGRTLELALTTTNTGAAQIDLEEALHPYLVVGDVRQVRIEGLDGAPYLDKVTRTERCQRGPVTVAGETDGVFRSAGPVTVVDPVLGRRLMVTTGGARNVVVWNPGPEKAADIGDILPGDWKRFVCVEAANALGDAAVVAPGESHTLTYRLAVEPL
ncbi:MAG: D-hexose-6-phosphate mutarotase [Dermatophilaceae bacterium]